MWKNVQTYEGTDKNTRLCAIDAIATCPNGNLQCSVKHFSLITGNII